LNTYYLVVATLQDELKQTKPFKSTEEELYLSIIRTAAVLEHALGQALKRYRITPTQYNVLRMLRGAGPAGLCRNEVGARLVANVPDVTRLLDRMEETGWIVRERGVADRRFVTAKISAAGLELVNKMDAAVAAIHRRQLGHVDKRAQRELINLLTRVRTGN
jgi:DNA-binding MarR family transcriptional regulator